MKKTLSNNQYDPRFADFICVLNEAAQILGYRLTISPFAKPNPKALHDAKQVVDCKAAS